MLLQLNSSNRRCQEPDVVESVEIANPVSNLTGFQNSAKSPQSPSEYGLRLRLRLTECQRHRIAVVPNGRPR